MKNYKLALLSLSLLASSASFAQAVLSTSCDVASKIKLPAGQTNFYMSEDCKTAYLLPPSSGSVTFGGIAVSESIDRCHELDRVMENLKELADKITSADLSFSKEVTPTNTNSTPVPNDTGVAGGFSGGAMSSWAPQPVPTTVPANQSVELTEEQVAALLIERQTLAKSMIEEYGKIPAAIIQLDYNTNYGELLIEARKLNAKLGINFANLPLKNTYLSFRSPNYKDSSSAMALSSGFPIQPTSVMNGSTSGSVELSLLGACPLRRATGRIPTRLTASRIAPYLVANLSYEYELLSTVKYTARFNRGGLARKIRTVSTRGGFFHTSSASKLMSSADSRSWFEYEGSCDESRACARANEETIAQIKNRLMNEVLSNIALVKIGYDLQPQASAQPAENGSTQSGRAIRENCAHPYCQAAGIFLEILGSAFGSTSKVDSFINKEDHWASETVTDKKPFNFVGTMGFTAKDRVK